MIRTAFGRRYHSAAVLLACTAALAATLALGGCQNKLAGPFDASPWFVAPAATTAASPARVGTVKRTELLIAYHKSATQTAYIRGLIAQRDAAKAAGDSKRVAELEREGEASQDLAHQRLLGKASMKPIIDEVRAKLEAVAKTAGVSSIVEEGSPLPPGAVAIDVTPHVVALFPPAATK